MKRLEEINFLNLPTVVVDGRTYMQPHLCGTKLVAAVVSHDEPADAGPREVLTEYITVAQQFIGSLIGKGGSMKSSIEQKSKASIYFPKKSDRDQV